MPFHAIMSHQQDHYHKMIELSAEARKAYEVMIANVETSSQEQLEEQLEVETPEEPSGTEEPEYSMCFYAL